jgi:L-fuconolactonase
MKGFRHVLQGEPDRALMLKPAFMNGISKLQQFGFTYDILIFPDQLRYAAELVAAFPDQKFVIDHIAKPAIKEKNTDGWKKDIQALAGMKTSTVKYQAWLPKQIGSNGTKRIFIHALIPWSIVLESTGLCLVPTGLFASWQLLIHR